MSTTRISLHLNAPRARVYRALLDARAVATWKVPTGMTSHVHAFDPREGGSFRISLTYDAADRDRQDDRAHRHVSRPLREARADEQVVEVIEFETTNPALQGEMTITITLERCRRRHRSPRRARRAPARRARRRQRDRLAARRSRSSRRSSKELSGTPWCGRGLHKVHHGRLLTRPLTWLAPAPTSIRFNEHRQDLDRATIFYSLQDVAEGIVFEVGRLPRFPASSRLPRAAARRRRNIATIAKVAAAREISTVAPAAGALLRSCGAKIENAVGIVVDHEGAEASQVVGVGERFTDRWSNDFGLGISSEDDRQEIESGPWSLATSRQNSAAARFMMTLQLGDPFMQAEERPAMPGKRKDVGADFALDLQQRVRENHRVDLHPAESARR